jgi:hypothetical protein
LPITEPDRESFAIVALGDFNPAIFQPLWFSQNGLMPEEETKNADIAIIHKQVASFMMGKVQVQVDDTRFALTTSESPQLPLLRDLAVGTITILEHSPLKAIGLNRDMMFTLETVEAWHAVGNRLVPKDDWATVLERPGMRQVAVEGKRNGCNADQLNIRVQPSADREVLIAVNQHYRLETEQRSEVRERHREALRVLQEDWTSFVDYAYNTACALLHFNSTQHTEQPA